MQPNRVVAICAVAIGILCVTTTVSGVFMKTMPSLVSVFVPSLIVLVMDAIGLSVYVYTVYFEKNQVAPAMDVHVIIEVTRNDIVACNVRDGSRDPSDSGESCDPSTIQMECDGV